MKKLFLLIATSMLMVATNDVSAQKIKLISGKLGALASESKMNVEYDYSSMRVGKFAKEQDYIDKKKSDYNEKEAGRGDKWEQSWKDDRAVRFHPQFEELFNKYSKVMIEEQGDTRYTMIVKTTRTEPGYNIHISRKNAEIDAEVMIVETANRSNVIAKLTIMKSPGRTFGGYDYDTGSRIQEAYAAAGKAMGKFMAKNVK
ncbi:MAG: hypothetical protein KDC11_05710 [Chitinophagaceae bacterium]|nr:hypothetical protein [Chitinophagaceae bacterium]